MKTQSVFDRFVPGKFERCWLALALCALYSCSGSRNAQTPPAPAATAAPAAASAPSPSAPASAEPTPTPSPPPTPSPTPAPAAPAAPAQGGKTASQPVTAADLKRLGYEPYGTATPEKMRRYVVGPVEEIEFWFPDSDPAQGMAAGLKKAFTTTPGQSYRLSVEIYDGYQEVKYPDHIVQKITVGGDTVDTHDISVPAFFGWRTVEKTFTANGPSTGVCAFLEVAGPLEHFNWGYASKSILRGVTLSPAR